MSQLGGQSYTYFSVLWFFWLSLIVSLSFYSLFKNVTHCSFKYSNHLPAIYHIIITLILTMHFHIWKTHFSTDLGDVWFTGWCESMDGVGRWRWRWIWARPIPTASCRGEHLLSVPCRTHQPSWQHWTQKVLSLHQWKVSCISSFVSSDFGFRQLKFIALNPLWPFPFSNQMSAPS